MAITIGTVRAVLAASKASREEFDSAIEAASDSLADEIAGPANECEENYETAIDLLIEDDLDGAREAILDAMSLEGEHIHYTHARAALAALGGAAL
jgi:hypothetical protein